MKNSQEILPPDSYQLDIEVDDLFTHGDVTSVSAWSGIRYSRLAAMLRTDDPQENCVTETHKLWYGMTKNDKEKGRALFRIFERQAAAWKLLDESPLSIMESVIFRLRQIRPEEVRRMSDNDQMKVLSYASIIEDLLEKMKKPACNAGSSICAPIGG